MEEYLSKEQKDSIMSAGASAFRAAFLPSGNPYNRSPHRELWQRGYKQAEDKFNGTTRRPKPHHTGRDNKRPAPSTRPVTLSVGKINHFNRKHKTQAA